MERAIAMIRILASFAIKSAVLISAITTGNAIQGSAIATRGSAATIAAKNTSCTELLMPTETLFVKKGGSGKFATRLGVKKIATTTANA